MKYCKIIVIQKQEYFEYSSFNSEKYATYFHENHRLMFYRAQGDRFQTGLEQNKFLSCLDENV